MDSDGYPDEQDLGRIVAFDSLHDPVGFVKLVRPLWSYPDRFVFTEGKSQTLGRPVWKLYLSTGGWSGNESLVDAMQEAGGGLWWFAFWLRSERGGHYWFEIPKAWNRPTNSAVTREVADAES